MKYIKICLVVLCFLGYKGAYAQTIIVFEKHKGLNKTKLSSGLYLFQNHVQLKSKDTILNIFNLYYAVDTLRSFGLDLDALNQSRKDISKLQSDILITAIPLVRPGEEMKFTKLTKQEFDRLSKENNDQLLQKAVLALYPNLVRNHNPPALKTLEYKLVVKEGVNYFRVEQPVFIEYNLVCAELGIFANQYRNGMLNVARPPFTRIFKKADLKEIATSKYKVIRNEVIDRTYISAIDTSYSYNPIFHFWKLPLEYPQRLNLERTWVEPQFAGIFNFQFLEKVGIINCRLDFFFNHDFKNNLGMGDCCINQLETFKITHINTLDFVSFQKAYRKYHAPKGIRWFDDVFN